VEQGRREQEGRPPNVRDALTPLRSDFEIWRPVPRLTVEVGDLGRPKPEAGLTGRYQLIELISKEILDEVCACACNVRRNVQPATCL